jgi:hypothetical protein
MTQTCGNCKWAEWRAEGEPRIGLCTRPLPPLPRPVKVKGGCIFSTDGKCKCWEVK